MISPSWFYTALAAALLLLAPVTGRTGEPAQGAVLGGAAGAVVGGGAGAAVGAVMGATGGAISQSKEQQEQARWRNYYQQQEKEAAEQKPSPPPTAVAQRAAAPQEPIPTGTALIKEIQRSLIVLGYDPGPVDGLTDGPTINAIRTYQEDNGLMTTGRASKDLLIHMRQNGG